MPPPPRHPPCPVREANATRHHGRVRSRRLFHVRTRTLQGIVLLFLSILPARAQGEIPEAPQEPARFLIETITVVGPKEAAANIVIAETLLEQGKTHTEDQLRQAIYRVHR